MTMFNLDTLIPWTVTVTDASGALSDSNIGPTVGTGHKLRVYQLTVNVHRATSINPVVRIGFGASAVPTAAAAGVRGVLFESQGMSAGVFGIGIDGIGAAGEELRATVTDPADGGVTISYLYQLVPV